MQVRVEAQAHSWLHKESRLAWATGDPVFYKKQNEGGRGCAGEVERLSIRGLGGGM